jgi:hypothetical protein
MKIENIIDDIKNDMAELRDKLAEQVKMENPDLNFSVSLPGIEELATVKALVLSIEDGAAKYCLSVQIHTHNGNRVFENEAKKIIGNEALPYCSRHPFQDKFVDLLRDIIKKKKNKIKSRSKPNKLYNDIRHYAHSA